MLQSCNSNSSGRDIAKQMGEIQVQYGAQTRKLIDGSGNVNTVGVCKFLASQTTPTSLAI